MASKKGKLENCVQCKGEKPDLYCPGCQGRFYHTECFDKAKRHRLDRGAPHRGHERLPLKLLGELDYINRPNRQMSVSGESILASQHDRFIRVDEQENYTLAFGPRAFPLLRPPPTACMAGAGASDDQSTQTPLMLNERRPGFISFLGDTGTGKSWILRSLLRAFPHYPAPLCSPGMQSNVVASTSSDITLYADGESASDVDPILFLDFEGLNGTDLPCTYSPQDCSNLPDNHLKTLIAQRRHYIENIYPRLAYAFSDCIVFVTTNTMQSREAVAKLIASFVNAHGTRFQSFKPALIIVYNKFANDDDDWSEETSTAAFLDPASSSEQQVKELQCYFDSIQVIKIPSSLGTLSHVAMAQICRLEVLLRKEYRLARIRRVESQMCFESVRLKRYLSSALRTFSQVDKDPVFDWVLASRDRLPGTLFTSRKEALASFWKHMMISHSRPNDLCPVEYFKCALEAFRSRLAFIIRLYIHRREIMSEIRRTIAYDLQSFQTDRASRDVPCRSSPCGGTRWLHRSGFHEGMDGARWPGAYEPALQLDQLVDLVPPQTSDDLTILDLPHSPLIPDYFPTENCSGCLFSPIATTLSCRHSFCEACVREVMGLDQALHLLPTIRCPFCSNHQTYSPRFLPDKAGYRILAIESDEMDRISSIKMLQSLERQCFGIPLRYLFDLIVGEYTGALLALAIGSTQPPMSLGLIGLEGRLLVMWGKNNSGGQRSSGDGNMSTSHENSNERMRRLFKSHDRPVERSDDCPHVMVTAKSVPGGCSLARVFANRYQGCRIVDNEVIDYFGIADMIDGTHKSAGLLTRIAIGEAVHLWPTKSRDFSILLNMGAEPVDTSTERLFQLHVCDTMLNQTWLEHERRTNMTDIANQLIAGLFYYEDILSPLAAHRHGEIRCRLPSDLEPRSKMAAHLAMVGATELHPLFLARWGVSICIEIDALPALRNLRIGQELSIKVDLTKSPEGFRPSLLNINMVDIFGTWQALRHQWHSEVQLIYIIIALYGVTNEHLFMLKPRT